MRRCLATNTLGANRLSLALLSVGRIDTALARCIRCRVFVRLAVGIKEHASSCSFICAIVHARCGPATAFARFNLAFGGHDVGDGASHGLSESSHGRLLLVFRR